MKTADRVRLFFSCCVFAAGMISGCREKTEPSDLHPAPQETLASPAETSLSRKTKVLFTDEPAQTNQATSTADLPEKPALINTQETYSQNDVVEFNLVVGDEIIYSIGPCNVWFEKKENLQWVKVGLCPNSSFTDEPFSLGPGDEMSMVMPLSYQSEDLYSYTLTAGKYRFAFSYWTDSQDEVVYSPEFEIRE